MTAGRRATVVLGALGLALSTYLTAEHYAQGGLPLACPASGPINCAQVTTSPQALVGPAPVALLGAAWFVVLLALSAWPAARRPALAARARLAWSLAGLAFVLYLIYVELFLVGAICLWCSAVHAIVVVVCLIALSEQLEAPEPGRRPLTDLPARPRPARDVGDFGGRRRGRRAPRR